MPKSKPNPRPRRKNARQQIPGGLDNSTTRLPVPQMPVYSFTRTYFVPVPTVPIGGIYPMSLAFSLANLPNFAEFVAMFDQYRLTRVDLSVIVGNSAIQMVACVDYNDSGLPATRNELLERAESETFHLAAGGTVEYKRWLKPRASLSLYNGIFTGYAFYDGPSPWIDCANSGVPHFGWKAVFLPCATGGSVDNSQVVVKVHLQCRGAK